MTREDKVKHHAEIEAWKKLGYDEDQLTICKQCNCVIPIEYLGTSELAIQDNICKDCMEDGYGR